MKSRKGKASEKFPRSLPKGVAIACAASECVDISENPVVTISRRSFLKRTSFSLAAACALPHLLGEEAPAPLEEFGYGDVHLLPSLAQEQFGQTQAVLLQMNVDGLLKPWRLRAGLPAPGPEMGGWYDEVPLAKTPSGGHGFAPAHSFGQWISALSRGYAVNRDQRGRGPR